MHFDCKYGMYTFNVMTTIVTTIVFLIHTKGFQFWFLKLLYLNEKLYEYQYIKIPKTNLNKKILAKNGDKSPTAVRYQIILYY